MLFPSGGIVLVILLFFHNTNGINGNPVHSDESQVKENNVTERDLTRYNLIRNDCFIPIMEALSSSYLSDDELKIFFINEFSTWKCIDNPSPLLKEQIGYGRIFLDSTKNELNTNAKLENYLNDHKFMQRNDNIHKKNVKRSIYNDAKFIEKCINGTTLPAKLQVLDTLLTQDPKIIREKFSKEIDSISSFLYYCKGEFEEFKMQLRKTMDLLNKNFSAGPNGDGFIDFFSILGIQLVHGSLKFISRYTHRFTTMENELKMLREISKSYSHDKPQLMLIIRDHLRDMEKMLQKSIGNLIIDDDILESRGISTYVDKIINMFGLREYQKINPSLLSAKDNALTWTTQTQPKLVITYENLENYLLHINQIETETNQLCKSLSFLYKIRNVKDLDIVVNSVEKEIIKNKTFLKVLLLFNQRLSKLRMTQSNDLKKSLSELKNTFYGDWDLLQRKLKGLLNHKSDLITKIDNLDKMRKNLDHKKKEVQRKLDNAIKSRDKHNRDKQISTGVLSGLSFLTVFIPVVGPILSGVFLAGSLSTEVGMTVSVADLTKVVQKLELEMNSINSEAASVVSRYSSNTINMRSINEFIDQLDGLTDVVDSVNVKFKIIQSFYSFNSGKLFSIIEQLEKITSHSNGDNFCFLKPNIHEMSEDFNILMDTIRNKKKIRPKRDIFSFPIVDVVGVHNPSSLTMFFEKTKLSREDTKLNGEETKLTKEDTELNDEETELKDEENEFKERQVLKSFFTKSIKTTDERMLFRKLLENQLQALDGVEAVLLKKDLDNLLTFDD